MPIRCRVSQTKSFWAPYTAARSSSARFAVDRSLGTPSDPPNDNVRSRRKSSLKMTPVSATLQHESMKRQARTAHYRGDDASNAYLRARLLARGMHGCDQRLGPRPARAQRDPPRWLCLQRSREHEWLLRAPG